MKKYLKVLFVAMVFIFAASLVAPIITDSYAQLTGQQKLLAKRAAQVDAYRNLAERVYGLQIDSQTYVRDFVAESDQIRTDLEQFLKGAKITRVNYLPDGTCEVEVEMTLQDIVTELESVKKQYQHLGHWKTIKFDKIYQYVDIKTISATGSGVPRGAEDVPSYITENIPGWEGVTTQGRLMAERAALVDGYRNLAEIIKGLKIDSQTYVRDFVAESDQINTDLDTFIKGIKPAGPYKYLPDGTCEVDVEVTVQMVVTQLNAIREKIHYWQNVRWKSVEFEKITDLYPEQVIRATGASVPPEKYKVSQASVTSQAPEWVSQSMVATGVGVPPEGATGTEAKLMAERAATVDALRNLAEKVYGVYIDSQTTVRDFVTQNDVIRAEVQTYMQGADVIDTRVKADGSVEVDVALPLENIWLVVEKYR